MSSELLEILGEEQSKVDTTLPDGGIPVAVGVQSYCVFRASRDVPELTDGRGWTYHHHVDMACWKGRLYVGWNSCEKDEDIWPSRELFSTSIDGVEWSPPQEMFPQGVSTALRMYFYHAPNGRMLMIAGLRAGTQKVQEDLKGGIVVREIRADHTLGEVFVLQAPAALAADHRPPMFQQSPDAGFVEACRSLLADTVFLEQQDRGRLLGERRMKWHHASAWPGGKVPGDNDKWVCGKAFSFFRRADGLLVGVCKMGWVTASADGGKTWSQPSVPPTFITGKAKAWAQQTRDGRYALVYNPSRRTRYPLIVVTSDDGQHFRDMRIVQGELPIQRYAGRDRSIGPQYTRGISQWADDGSRAAERVMWLAYSMNKEDIWVSRVPLPIKPDATSDDEPWNLYVPKWTKIQAIEGGGIRIEDRDPYDYARAIKVFRESRSVSVSLDVVADQVGRGTLQIELMGKFGSPRPVRVWLLPQGQIYMRDGQRDVPVGSYSAGQKVSLSIMADVSRGRYALEINGRLAAREAAFAEPAELLRQISLRSGEYRGIGGLNPVPPGTDRPTEPCSYQIANLRISTSSGE
ncbi:exo-alpha-sialidase [Fontivita pretiosa]|uniref:exo-alpha-sialidase n=1 Tax=Fontivita pretiosa TaxID=2989684 RepID=UPI003D183304